MTGDPDQVLRDDLPSWAKRIRAERRARDWSQRDSIRALRVHAGSEQLPSDASLIRNWRRWESGEVEPDDYYKPLIAKTFGTVTTAIFPRSASRDADSELLAGTGLDTLEIVSRLRASDVSATTLEAVRITVDRLCSEYPYMQAQQLHIEGQAWLRRITALLDRRLTLSQHIEVLNLAGWVALLVGCVEYDMGRRQPAEATRRAALSLGEESGTAEIMGWAHEMRAWYALTQGDYRGVIAASETGNKLAPSHSVAVQLAAQRAKAWARMGDRRQVEVALETGRVMLDQLPYPDNLDHHFVVDPAKFDFYAMDCYRIVGENEFARTYADEVIRASADASGVERKPMRIAEARITLAVVEAREGDLSAAVRHGETAISGERKSLPSLLFAEREFSSILAEKYSNEPLARSYLEAVRSIDSRA
ncbi:helix-turn-helix domain-containing protein [Phytohabitans rumicis]|uniref:XRE family transcriptional regulator n=1 Tax=Phytohabitans rumicis TaxID=1076125 RepID=A0A6V8L4B1_9ACTN|nr:XRE family transcriptional regulator [Phytohabitans rumicis]GFJ91044.1 hypothetical protein Prum_046860 [Phytohabitans rumicis]